MFYSTSSASLCHVGKGQRDDKKTQRLGIRIRLDKNIEETVAPTSDATHGGRREATGAGGTLRKEERENVGNGER